MRGGKWNVFYGRILFVANKHGEGFVMRMLRVMRVVQVVILVRVMGMHSDRKSSIVNHSMQTSHSSLRFVSVGKEKRRLSSHIPT
jgi:hypothetical protein